MRDCPSPPLQCSGNPALFAMCLFCCCSLVFSLFFPFSLARGQSVQGAMLIWSRVVCGSSACRSAPLCSASSQVVCELVSGSGMGAFLVSPFNVAWRCYAQAGGVEESKFCLFSVVFPVRCIVSVSPRFYFSRHAFWFPPLFAMLESQMPFFKLTTSVFYLSQWYKVD
jgi:hypothetical protein